MTGDGRKKTGDGKRETEHRKTGSLTSYQKKFSAFNLVGEFVNFMFIDNRKYKLAVAAKSATWG